jgi:hypothetical protein
MESFKRALFAETLNESPSTTEQRAPSTRRRHAVDLGPGS